MLVACSGSATDRGLAGPQSALFDFSSFVTVILLFICGCAYLHGKAPDMLNRNKVSALSNENRSWIRRRCCLGCCDVMRFTPLLRMCADGFFWCVLEGGPHRRETKPVGIGCLYCDGIAHPIRERVNAWSDTLRRVGERVVVELSDGEVGPFGSFA